MDRSDDPMLGNQTVLALIGTRLRTMIESKVGGSIFAGLFPSRKT
jgi:hypothetical protein